MKQAMELYDIVSQSFPGEVVLEDRLHLTLGARLRDLESQGYLVSIIVGDKVKINSGAFLRLSIIFVF